MKINEALLSRLRDITRKPITRSAGKAQVRNVVDGLLTPAGAPHPTQLPSFVTDLLNQLGFVIPGTPGAQPAPDEAIVSVSNDATTGAPGQFITRSFRCIQGARNYKLYIPKAYSGKPLPLLVMLHGCTQSPDDFSAGTRANAIADELACFVVYPAQTSAANSSKCWNWFQPGDQKADAGEPAIIAGIARTVMAHYAIDDDRVFIAGLSAGGAMAAVVAAAYPTLFAAVGVHSGLPVGVACDVNTALAAMRDGGKRSGAKVPASNGANGTPPMIIFQGDEDKTVHPRNAEALLAQCVAGRVSQTVEEEHKPASGRSYTRTTVIDERGSRIAELWLIHLGGHAWAGGDTAGSYADPKGPDATRAMLAFFMAHPKR